jgi:hypothetical protein
MAGFFGGLITGLICTLVGIYLTWLAGKDDRRKARQLADAQTRISQLETEKSRREALEQFMPRIAVVGTPPSSQSITVTDSGRFRVAEMDYMTAEGVKVATQLVDRTGTVVQIPIDESSVTEVQKRGCDPRDGSFSMSFRIHIEVDGGMKPCLLPVKVAVNSVHKLEPMLLGAQPLKK